MASKKGVVLYYEILEQLEDLTDEQFGKVARAIIKYDKTGIIPEFDDVTIKISFKCVKPTIDRNKQEYEDMCEKNRQNIQKRWNKENTNEYDRIQPNTKNTDIDKDKDKDIDKDKDKVKDKVKEIIKEIESEELRTEIQEFVKMRTKIKKPLTAHALELVLKELNKITPNTEEQVKIVQQSIKNGWQGVFPLKEEKKQDSFEKFKEIAKNYDFGG